MIIKDVLFRGGCALDRLMYGTKFGTILKLNNKKSGDSESSSGDEQPWDFLNDHSKGGAFDDLTESIKSTGSSFNEMVGVGAMSVIWAAIIFSGMEFAMYKNGTKKQELKEHLPYLLLAVILSGGTTVVFYLGYSIVKGIIASL